MTTETVTAQDQSGQTGNQPAGDSNAGQTANQSGNQTGATFTPEQQEHINAMLKKEREEARKQAQKDYEAKQKAAQDQAEQERLKQQQEWQTLAQQHEAKVNELAPQLESLTDQLKEYRKMAETILEAEITALGAAAKTAVDNLPGKPDALAKLQWLNANKSLFQPAQPATPPQPQRGTPQRRGNFQPTPAPGATPPVNEVPTPVIRF